MTTPDRFEGDDVELLNEERAYNYEQIIGNLFCDDQTGLHVFFQRNDKNASFIHWLVQLEHQLDGRTLFENSKDSDGLVDGKKLIDKLLAIFNQAGGVIASTDTAIFAEAHLTKAEFMSHLQRGLVKASKIFEDSGFEAEDHFLEGIAPAYMSYGGSAQPKPSVPPASILDMKPSSAPQPQTSESESKMKGAKIITISFEREGAIRQMLHEVGLRITAENFSDDDIAKVAMPEILRVADFAIRRFSRAIIRRTPHRDLEDLIQRTTVEIIGKLQDMAMEHKDKPVSGIIIYFYSTGKDSLRNELEKKIHEEVGAYFREVHQSPVTTMPGTRTPTKRPSNHAVPAPQPLAAPLPKAGVRSPSSPNNPVVAAPINVPPRYLKTQRPPDFVRDLSNGEPDTADTGIEDEPTQVDIPKFSVPAGIETLTGSDDDLVPQHTAPAASRSPSESSPPAPVPPIAPPAAPAPLPPKGTASRMLADIFSDPDEVTQNPITAPVQPSERPAPMPIPIVKGYEPLSRPVSEIPLPPSSKDILKQEPVIQYREGSSAPPAAPAGSTHFQTTPGAPEQQLPQSSHIPAVTPPARQAPVQPPRTPAAEPVKKPGFFGKAKRWIVGAAMAAAAAVGIYTVTQTKGTSPEGEAPVASTTSTSSDSAKKPQQVSSVLSTGPVAASTQATSSPAVTQQPQAPQVPVVEQKAPEAVSKVETVLGSYNYGLGSSDGAKPFTGTAALAEGGVDATPFATGLKSATWYENQKKTAETLLKIYGSNKGQLDKDALNFITTHEAMLRDLAAQSDFSPVQFKKHFEERYDAADVFGSNGLYNNLLAFQRIVNLYGGDVEKILKDKTVIKFIVGSRVMAPEMRYAKAVQPAVNPGTNLKAPAGNGDPAPVPAPAGDKDQHGFNQKAPKASGEKFGYNMLHQGVDMDAIDAGWDAIANEHAAKAEKHQQLRAELNAKVAKLFASVKPAVQADDTPEIEVSEVEVHPAEFVEMDRKSALLERGELVVPPVSDTQSGSVLQAIENGFLKECTSTYQMDRVQQRVAKIRMSKLAEYEVLDNGRIYAKISAEDLADLRKIVV